MRNDKNLNLFRINGMAAIFLLPLLLFSGTNMTVLADDCDNWGRVMHVGRQASDDLCTLRAGASNGVTRQLEDRFDYDYFVFYLGYDLDTPINQRYKATLTDTGLTRPKVTVGTFYDGAALPLPGQRPEDAQTLPDFWFAQHGSGLGMSEVEFTNMVTLAPNLQHDGVYDYVNGQVVVVQESSDAAIRQMYYAVPVGTVLATNQSTDDPGTPQSEKYDLYFTPPDRGAYIVVVSNHSSSRRKGSLTGSYKLTVYLD